MELEAATMDSDCDSESDIEASIVVKPTLSLHPGNLDILPSAELRYYFCMYLVKYQA